MTEIMAPTCPGPKRQRWRSASWSLEEIPEPHAFTAYLQMGGQSYAVDFVEHEQAHSATARDNNMRAAIIHVIADAAVSVFVIVGLSLAFAFGWLWMDPLARIIGAIR